jgi:hypothetical protein
VVYLKGSPLIEHDLLVRAEVAHAKAVFFIAAQVSDC